MYEAILVLQYAVCEQTPVGKTPVLATISRHIKTINGITIEDCKKKIDEFISDNEFILLKGK